MIFNFFIVSFVPRILAAVGDGAHCLKLPRRAVRARRALSQAGPRSAAAGMNSMLASNSS